MTGSSPKRPCRNRNGLLRTVVTAPPRRAAKLRGALLCEGLGALTHLVRADKPPCDLTAKLQAGPLQIEQIRERDLGDAQALRALGQQLRGPLRNLSVE